MIQLHSHCLAFEQSDGGAIPCSAEQITVEIIGAAAANLDHEIIRNAAAAVLHYFKAELGRTHVTLGEFTQALDRVLRGLGMELEFPPSPQPAPGVAESDLRLLACAASSGYELDFFPRLREELRGQLRESPRLLRFRGLRGCVKQLAGARRWNGRCEALSDQIVDYLRTCLGALAAGRECALVVE